MDSTSTCDICGADAPCFTVSPCSHSWCSPCLEQSFFVARNEGNWPPRCCLPIDFASVQHLLSDELVRYLRTRIPEFETPPQRRLYCAHCHGFIPPTDDTAEQDKLVSCPSCSKRTCRECKSKEHEGECTTDNSDQNAWDQASAETGAKICPGCHTVMVLRGEGCAHMVCPHALCKHHFCWFCLEPWLECRGACQNGIRDLRERDIDPDIIRVVENDARERILRGLEQALDAGNDEHGNPFDIGDPEELEGRVQDALNELNERIFRLYDGLREAQRRREPEELDDFVRRIRAVRDEVDERLPGLRAALRLALHRREADERLNQEHIRNPLPFDRLRDLRGLRRRPAFEPRFSWWVSLIILLELVFLTVVIMIDNGWI